METIYHFQETYFTDVFSLEANDQYKDGEFQVSGINGKGQPINIIYDTTGGDDVSSYQLYCNYFSPGISSFLPDYLFPPGILYAHIFQSKLSIWYLNLSWYLTSLEL